MEKKKVEDFVASVVEQQMSVFMTKVQDTYNSRYDEIVQERKETLAIVNRLSKYVESVESKVEKLSAAVDDPDRYSKSVTSSSFDTLSRRVDALTSVCGYDINVEHIDIHLLHTRCIKDRLDTIESTIRQLNGDVNMLMKEGILSRVSQQNEDGDRCFDGFLPDRADGSPQPRLMPPKELHRLLNGLDNAYPESDKDRSSSKSAGSRRGRSRSPAMESSRNPYNTPHPPGFRSLPTKTRPHSRPTSAPANKQFSQQDDGVKSERHIIHQLIETVSDHEEKITMLRAELNHISRGGGGSKAVMKKLEELANHDVVIEERIKASTEQSRAFTERINDLTKIIYLEEDEKKKLESKIQQMEGQLKDSAQQNAGGREAAMEELKNSRAMIQSMNEQAAYLQSELNKEHRERERIERLRDELASSSEFDKKILQDKLQASQAAVESERARTATVQREYEDARVRFERERQQMQDKLSTISYDAETSRNKHLSLSKQLEECRKEIQEKEEEAAERLQSTRKTLESKFYVLREERDELAEEVVVLKRKLSAEIENGKQKERDFQFETDKLKKELSQLKTSEANRARSEGPSLLTSEDTPTIQPGPLVLSPDQLRTLSRELSASYSADNSPAPLDTRFKKKESDETDYRKQFPTPYPHSKTEQRKRQSSPDSKSPVEKARPNKYTDKEYLLNEIAVLEEIVGEKKSAVEKAIEEKSAIKSRIKNWISEFQNSHGRQPNSDEKEEIADFYIAHQKAALIRDEAAQQLEDAIKLLEEKQSALGQIDDS
mmetsp:Transcript_5032/g.7692  ORF Transcript_5032/g.7692 Transcript_5032/m.7692 type:complete len:778 (-) Transcript_5032:159-2492(-)|eukprot:CAMPEP_0185030294 /NCGR_PEP_ID=MMETSP1103-20130426/17171_1 /TAXON_ID=36769 /ORGANISM="Paraphysomonas bandaiensis, Strain Caron Lab Isolate" /LENGTH=777 /DNA_ID=CAMNT_0027565365 /DNA_START=39 /DNA_END=2372 /DNA_ORIENTATION=+